MVTLKIIILMNIRIKYWYYLCDIFKDIGNIFKRKYISVLNIRFNNKYLIYV